MSSFWTFILSICARVGHCARQLTRLISTNTPAVLTLLMPLGHMVELRYIAPIFQYPCSRRPCSRRLLHDCRFWNFVRDRVHTRFIRGHAAFEVHDGGTKGIDLGNFLSVHDNQPKNRRPCAVSCHRVSFPFMPGRHERAALACIDGKGSPGDERQELAAAALRLLMPWFGFSASLCCLLESGSVSV